MASQIEAASRALYRTAAPVTPALCGCPNCGTVRVIATPARSCSGCGADLEMLPATGAAVRAPVDPAAVA